MAIFLRGQAPGTPPPVPPPPAWTGITSMTWTGWDGSVWPLLDFTSGAYLVDEAVRGLGMPEFVRHTSSAQSVPGSRWRGWDVDEREVFWPVAVSSTASTRAWVNTHDAFMRTMRPDKTGVWEVTTHRGARRLRLRFKDDSGGPMDVDPSLTGWLVYGLRLVAEDPYWRGDPITYTWVSDQGKRAFLPAAGQTSFRLTSAFTAGAAQVTNPGDVDSYPVHVFTGPLNSGAKVGVGASTVTVPFAISAGDSLTIDTRPDRLTVVDAASTSRFVDLTGDLAFAPIPPGEVVPLTVVFTGAGSISTSFEPAHFRGF